MPQSEPPDTADASPPIKPSVRSAARTVYETPHILDRIRSLMNDDQRRYKVLYKKRDDTEEDDDDEESEKETAPRKPIRRNNTMAKRAVTSTLHDERKSLPIVAIAAKLAMQRSGQAGFTVVTRELYRKIHWCRLVHSIYNRERADTYLPFIRHVEYSAADCVCRDADTNSADESDDCDDLDTDTESLDEDAESFHEDNEYLESNTDSLDSNAEPRINHCRERLTPSDIRSIQDKCPNLMTVVEHHEVPMDGFWGGELQEIIEHRLHLDGGSSRHIRFPTLLDIEDVPIKDLVGDMWQYPYDDDGAWEETSASYDLELFIVGDPKRLPRFLNAVKKSAPPTSTTIRIVSVSADCSHAQLATYVDLVAAFRTIGLSVPTYRLWGLDSMPAVDVHRFLEQAGSDLEWLELRYLGTRLGTQNATLTIADMPNVARAIRSHTPSLRKLQLSIEHEGGSPMPESWKSGGCSRAQGVRQGGSLQDIQIDDGNDHWIEPLVYFVKGSHAAVQDALLNLSPDDDRLERGIHTVKSLKRLVRKIEPDGWKGKWPPMRK